MRLALFDLDHTLIPFDSGMAWTDFLTAQGALPPDAPQRYLDFCHQYVAGTLDIHAMHHATVAPLAAFAPAQLRAWQDAFSQALAPRIPAATQARVAEHRAAGDTCLIVTATERLVAEPVARHFAIDGLLATEGVWQDGRPVGRIAGLPCFREHKLAHVRTWLARQGLDELESELALSQATFYSDSASDLPLLRAVGHPVAVDPDERLAAEARARGWPIWCAR
jgi:HAD superfamily hydrolase (TIGR01490 family)